MTDLSDTIASTAASTYKKTCVELADDGEFELSKTESGVSMVKFYKHFIPEDEAEKIFETLKTELQWQTRKNEKFNQIEPRLTSWQGQYRYIYWDIEWPAAPFTTTTEMLRQRLNKFLNYKLNSVLANYYRDGRDIVPWHSDDEPELGKKPLIASLTFGATRKFELRRKQSVNANPEDYENAETLSFLLNSGSLLIMEGATQEDWEHQIPRVTGKCEPRINLTYRIIYPS